MAKLVITKNRDIADQPTLFLDNKGNWHSVANKQDFQTIADKVKVEYDQAKARTLVSSIEDWTNVRINIEMTPVDFIDFSRK